MTNNNFLKIGKAVELGGRDYYVYRVLEGLPAFLVLSTFLFLIILSYFDPILTSYILIAFDVYWLLLVIYLSIHLISAYRAMQANLKIDWQEKCTELEKNQQELKPSELVHLVILPTYKESLEIVLSNIQSLINSQYEPQRMIVVLAVEERAGKEFLENAKKIKTQLGDNFKHFLITVHPDNIAGEIKGKGANQAWAARIVKKEIIDKEKIDPEKIIVSIFDIDTVVCPGYFHCLSYRFIIAPNRYRASYQPIPLYNNNIWKAPFFARVAASSNTFWQMMQQIRQEKLATYSSHSMSWKALVEVNFWSTNMVSEDSRIFWHCLLFYKGDYRVEPLYFPVSMDVCMDRNFFLTALNLYKQQRRWGWGVENIPYLIFNTIKNWQDLSRVKFVKHILYQLYGFHSWASNALIISVFSWMPIILGGEAFRETVLSSNLPGVNSLLMRFAMIGLIISAALSTLLLPRTPYHGLFRKISMFFQWLCLPITIIFFGSIPALESQIRLMFGKYLGFWVTPKER